MARTDDGKGERWWLSLHASRQADPRSEVICVLGKAESRLSKPSTDVKTMQTWSRPLATLARSVYWGSVHTTSAVTSLGKRNRKIHSCRILPETVITEPHQWGHR